jgi:hypothetical protein
MTLQRDVELLHWVNTRLHAKANCYIEPDSSLHAIVPSSSLWPDQRARERNQ